MDSLKDIGKRSPARPTLLYALLVFLLAASFVFSRQLPLPASLPALLAAFPLGGLFGMMVAGFDRLWQWAAARLRGKADLSGVTAGCLLFLGYVIGYILLFSGLITYPMGLIIGAGAVTSAPELDFRLYSMNFVLLLAIWSWLAGKIAKWL